MTQTRRRVVVTGIGVVGPCGIGREAFFDGLLEPPVTPERVVPEFDLSPFFESPKDSRRLDRFTHFAMACAHEALEQSGDLALDPTRVGTLIGTGVGGLDSIETQVLVLQEKGPRRVSPFLVPMMMANAAAANVSMKYGFQGPCEATVTACAASNQSIGNAVNMIRWGLADAMISGGSEAPLTPTGQQGFINMTATSSAGISRPFDVDRDGFMQAEGAGVLVLEEMEHAKARGATILAEVAGYSTNADAHHITAPAPGGVGAKRCMRDAIADAGLEPSDIAHVNAHGTSTPLNDAAEAEAIAEIFGSPGPAVTSTKGVTGHALGAAGALEAVAVVMAMQRGIIPPTAGYVNKDPELADVDIVHGQPRAWEPAPTLSNSLGFGGHNASLVFTPPE